MKDVTSDGGWLDLADAIGLLRAQLMEAQRRAAHADIRFALGEVTLEFEVELARVRGASGGLRFAVAEVGAHGDRTSRGAHHVTITLTPETAAGEPVDVSDEDGP